MKPLPCPEKTRLSSAYQEATLKYAAAIAVLNRNIGICTKNRYDVLFSSAQEARANAAAARESLSQHIDTHHC